MSELTSKFKPVTVTTVNQCSGNSRNRLQPRVPGGQWGQGAKGNPKWTGAPLRELLDSAKIKQHARAVQFLGLDKGKGRKDMARTNFLNRST